MPRTDLRLDHGGIAEVLTVNCRAAVDAATEAIAADVRSQQPGAEVEAESDTTDRARGTVVVKDPRAALWQARDGLLTKAAASVGLEVRAR